MYVRAAVLLAERCSESLCSQSDKVYPKPQFSWLKMIVAPLQPVMDHPPSASALPIEVRMRCKVFWDQEDPGIQINILAKISPQDITFRHSGESVRPHVIQTYCSALCAFFD
jgi:hypothetical protein